MNLSRPQSLLRAQSGHPFIAAVSAFLVWGALTSAVVWHALHGWAWSVPTGAAGVPSVSSTVSWSAVESALAVIESDRGAEKASAKSLKATVNVQVLGVVAGSQRAGAALLKVGTEAVRPYQKGVEVPGVGWLVAVSAEEIQFSDTMHGKVTRKLPVPQRPIATRTP